MAGGTVILPRVPPVEPRRTEASLRSTEAKLLTATERAPEQPKDGFDDILARIEALRASTSARIAELNVALDDGPADDLVPPPTAPAVDVPPKTPPPAEPVPAAAAIPAVAPPGGTVPHPDAPPAPAPAPTRRVIVIDDLATPAPPSSLSIPTGVPGRTARPRLRFPRITLPTLRIPRIPLPTLRIPRIPRITLPTLPALTVPRPVLAVAGGVVTLLVVAGLAPTPSRDAAPEAPVVMEFVPDPSTAIAPVVPPPSPEPEPVEEVRSVPLAVRIPAIQVDATTVPVGLEVDGSMEIPSNVATIGWYEPAEGLGVRPGQTGTAVLAGHVDSRTQGAGAFYDLRDLSVGDRIEIVHEDGTTSTWRVTQVTQYRKDELPLEEVFVWTGPPRLALITCGGAFDWTARSYTDNLVVYAEPDMLATPVT